MFSRRSDAGSRERPRPGPGLGLGHTCLLSHKHRPVCSPGLHTIICNHISLVVTTPINILQPLFIALIIMNTRPEGILAYIWSITIIEYQKLRSIILLCLLPSLLSECVWRDQRSLMRWLKHSRRLQHNSAASIFIPNLYSDYPPPIQYSISFSGRR